MRRREKLPNTARVVLSVPEFADATEFLAAIERSRELHAEWISPPRTGAAYCGYVQFVHGGEAWGWLVRHWADNRLVGVVNVRAIRRRGLSAGCLSYYAFAPNQGSGLMTEAVAAALDRVFHRPGLRQVTCDIHPANEASRALVRRHGFRKEERPCRVRVHGRWHDYERWILPQERWRSPSRGGPARVAGPPIFRRRVPMDGAYHEELQ